MCVIHDAIFGIPFILWKYLSLKEKTLSTKLLFSNSQIILEKPINVFKKNVGNCICIITTNLFEFSQLFFVFKIKSFFFNSNFNSKSFRIFKNQNLIWMIAKFTCMYTCTYTCPLTTSYTLSTCERDTIRVVNYYIIKATVTQCYPKTTISYMYVLQ